MTVISSAEELLPHGDLVDVRFLKFSAEALDEPRPNFEDGDIEQTMQVVVGGSETAIEVRVDLTLLTATATYEVLAATQFHYAEGLEVSAEVAGEFAEKVGVMAVYPYLREAIQDFSGRLRNGPITIALMRQTKLTPADPAED